MSSRRPAIAVAGLLLIATSCGRAPERLAGPMTPIFPQGAGSGLGKHTRFYWSFLGDSAAWSVDGAPQMGVISPTGIYYAPLSMPATAQVTIRASTPRASGEAHLNLWNVPADSADCFAEGQPDLGSNQGTYVYVDDLPEAVVMPAPIYPDSARAAGIQGQVMVQALVCACGEVGDVRVVKSIPALDAAAVAAARQWVFLPARSQGEPVAVWVAIPFQFALH